MVPPGGARSTAPAPTAAPAASATNQGYGAPQQATAWDPRRPAPVMQLQAMAQPAPHNQPGQVQYVISAVQYPQQQQVLYPPSHQFALQPQQQHLFPGQPASQQPFMQQQQPAGGMQHGQRGPPPPFVQLPAASYMDRSRAASGMHAGAAPPSAGPAAVAQPSPRGRPRTEFPPAQELKVIGLARHRLRGTRCRQRRTEEAASGRRAQLHCIACMQPAVACRARASASQCTPHAALLVCPAYIMRHAACVSVLHRCVCACMHVCAWHVAAAPACQSRYPLGEGAASPGDADHHQQ